MSHYRRKDHYYRKAKGEGFCSRAAFKLEQIQASARIMKRGDIVVDVGCSPGGWSQVALKIVGVDGCVIGIDILNDCTIGGNNFVFLLRDVRDDESPKEVLSHAGKKIDVVISDAAPNTTGVKFVDQARSDELVRDVLHFSNEVLRDGGNFLAKVFEGPDTGKLIDEMKVFFKKVVKKRPPATRKESSEIYLIGWGFRSLIADPLD